MELGLLIQSLQLLVLLIIGIIVLLAKNVLPSYLSEKGKNIATKQDIEAITRKIESIKAEVASQQAWTSLFQQRKFEVVAKTYELLHDPEEHIRHMVQPLQSGGEGEEAGRHQQAAAAFNNLSGFYWKNKIYLPEDICVKVEAVLDAMKGAFNKYKIGRDHCDAERGLVLWEEAFDAMKITVPKLRAELEHLFREAALGQGHEEM
ncbi:MAG TPA: hypothetical protein VN493_06480 [Thermoanaerobaculia bacterium]|nr:hypothetical protein [Thermoanaerobaculia bacterium]